MGTRTPLFVRRQKGGMFSITDVSMTTGDIWFVHAGTGTDGPGYGQNPDSPTATLDYAIGLCTASKGDRIYLMPGHAENITSATGALLDVAGVEVIGLGRGALRPALTLTTAAGATLSVTAGSCLVKNVRITSNFATGVTAGITIGAAADGLVLEDILMTETANTKEFLLGISIAADCDDLVIRGLRYIGLDGGSTTSFIEAAGGTDRLQFHNSFLRGDASAAAVKLDNAASTDIELLDLRVINIDTAAGLGVAMHNSCTGYADRVDVTNLKDAVVGISGTGMAYGQDCRYSNAVGASTRVAITADS